MQQYIPLTPRTSPASSSRGSGVQQQQHEDQQMYQFDCDIERAFLSFNLTVQRQLSLGGGFRFPSLKLILQACFDSPPLLLIHAFYLFFLLFTFICLPFMFSLFSAHCRFIQKPCDLYTDFNGVFSPKKVGALAEQLLALFVALL